MGLAPAGPRTFFERSTAGHVDLPRARAGGLGGGLFSISLSGRIRPPGAPDLPPLDPSEAPRNDWMTRVQAQSDVLYWLGSLFALERESKGECRIIRTAAELDHCLRHEVFAIGLHLEGSSALDVDGHALEVFYQAGVRSLGIAHFRPTVFATGVPRLFPHTPDAGSGLTDAGKALVRQCNRLRVLVDLSHANAKTFWDVAYITDAPLVATHSNAWHLSPSPRNLADDQLAAIRDSGGLVGLNFYVAMLRTDGERNSRTPLSLILDHLDYLVDKLGIDCVGFGSDFDGAPIPQDLQDAAGLPKLMEGLVQRGYAEDALRKLAHGNWLRVLHRSWPA